MLNAAVMIPAMALSVVCVLPAVGSYAYAIGGILCGLIAMMVAMRTSLHEHAGFMVALAVSVMLGIAAGIFWPAALVALLLWLSAGGSKIHGPA